MNESNKIKAVIFDLDGVLVDTAGYHYAAWHRLALSLGIEFSKKDNEQLKGVSRIESCRFILKMGGIVKTEEEINELCALKNSWYLETIVGMDKSELLPGTEKLLKSLQMHGIKIGLGSASKNARTILDATGIDHYFDAHIDGNDVTKSKPDPEVFLMGAQKLDLDPHDIVVVEDSIKGIEAALKGGFITLGIGLSSVLIDAHHVETGLEHVDITLLKNLQQVAQGSKVQL